MSYLRLLLIIGVVLVVVSVAPAQPSTPINVTITGSTGQHPTVSWTDTSRGLYGFKVYRKIDPTDTGFTVIANLGASTHSYTDNDCTVRTGTAGLWAIYKIRAYDTLGRLSDYSLQVSKPVNYAPPKVGNGEDFSGVIPDEFELIQAYPNPFNPETTIGFALPTDAHVHFAIFDALGREVAILTNDAMTAGLHSFRWHAQGMASGVYLARFEASDAVGKALFTTTNKLLLMK